MRKLTLLIEDEVYEGLHRVVGRGNIGRFVSEKVRPYIVAPKQGSAEQAFGMLRHLARPGTPAQQREAQRAYMAERWAGKQRRGR